MPPLLVAGVGLVLVVVPFTGHGVDTAIDAVGLALFAYATWRLANRSHLFGLAGVLAGFAALVAVLDVVPSQRGSQGTVGLTDAYNILLAGAMVLAASALRGQAKTYDERIQTAFPGIVGLAALAGIGGAVSWGLHAGQLHASDIAGDGAKVAATVAMVLLAVACFSIASKPWSQPLLPARPRQQRPPD